MLASAPAHNPRPCCVRARMVCHDGSAISAAPCAAQGCIYVTLVMQEGNLVVMHFPEESRFHINSLPVVLEYFSAYYSTESSYCVCSAACN